MAAIFISYRREDTPDAADRLWEALSKTYTKTCEVFYDHESIASGENYETTMLEAAGNAQIMLVLIGPAWRPERLHKPDDAVVKEIEAGRHKGAMVLPVLVGGASMPALGELPASLAWFQKQNAATLGAGPHFRRDLPSLLERVASELEKRRASTQAPVVFFRHLTFRWECPDGVRPLEPAYVSKRMESWRFEYEEGRVVRFGQVSRPDTPLSEVAHDVCVYSDEGRIKTITSLDERGVETCRKDFSHDLRIVELSAPGGGRAQYRVTHDEEGYRRKIEYKNALGHALRGGDLPIDDPLKDVHLRTGFLWLLFAPDTGGYFGLVFERDKDGLIIKQCGLDQLGQRLEAIGKDPEAHPKPVECRFERNQEGEVTHLRYHDAERRPCLHWTDVYHVTQGFDEVGNCTEEQYFGAQGEPVTLSSGQHHKTTYGYDDQGNPSRQSTFGLDGEPVLNADAYASVTWEYAADGEVTRVSYFGVSGDAVMCALDGAASVTWERDADGEVTRERYFGLKGEAILGPKGYHRVDTERSRTRRKGVPSRVVKERYYGCDDAPVLCLDGYHRKVECFAEEAYAQGEGPLERAFFGYEGEPLETIEGYQRVLFNYDADWRPTRERYRGLRDKAALCRGGYAKKEITYDASGEEAEERFYDRNGALLDAAERELRQDALYWRLMVATDRELQALSKLLELDSVSEEKGFVKMVSQSLRKAKRDARQKEISAALRKAAGVSAANLFRDPHALSYKEILVDVAAKLGETFTASPFTLADDVTEDKLEAHLIAVSVEAMQADLEARDADERLEHALTYEEALKRGRMDKATREAVLQSIIDAETATDLDATSPLAQWLFYQGGLGDLILSVSEVAHAHIPDVFKGESAMFGTEYNKTIPACALLAGINARYRVERTPKRRA